MGFFDFLKKGKTQQQNIHEYQEISIFPTDEILPIENRILGQQPTCDGLYPHEVLILSYAPRFAANGNNSYAGFWWYKYGIKDVETYLNSLKGKGYLQIGTIKDALQFEKLPIIKAELKNRGCKVSGKKAELIERLMEAAPENELNQIFTKRPYQLTKLGEEILRKYEWIPYIHSHNLEDLDIWNLTNLVQKPPYYLKYQDKIWAYLDERSRLHYRDNNFGLYRNCRLSMSNFAKKEGNKEVAFFLLCEVIFYDLSGLENGFSKEFLDIYSESFFPYENSLVKIPPGITEMISEYMSEFGWTKQELQKNLLYNFEQIPLNFKLFTNEECVNIVIAEIEKDENRLKDIYRQAEIRFKKYYKK